MQNMSGMLICAATLVLISSVSPAQDKESAPLGIKPSVLYRFFVSHDAQLREASTASDGSVTGNTAFLEYNLTQTDVDKVTSLSRSLLSKIEAINNEASRLPAQGSSSAATAEVRRIHYRRIEAINLAAMQLRKTLGPESFAKLTRYLNEELARRINSRSLSAKP